MDFSENGSVDDRCQLFSILGPQTAVEAGDTEHED